VVDLWQTDPAAGLEGPAHGVNSSCYGSQASGAQPDTCDGGPRGDHWWGGYEDSIFEQHVLQLVEAHDSATPLFLFWAPHIVHAPLQVPQAFIDKFAFMAPTDKPEHQRQYYHAMVNFADTMVGNLTSLLKRKGMWQDTLVFFSTDNGGPIYNNGSAGANNFPLRGGKMNNWEGDQLIKRTAPPAHPPALRTLLPARQAASAATRSSAAASCRPACAACASTA
jgi:arylsulfatase I/J